MKKWLTKITKAVPFSLLATLLIGITVLAAAYAVPLTITETSGTAYDMLPVITDAPIQWMVDNDYMDADGLDTLVETAGGVTKPHMVVDDKVLTATPVSADSQTNLVFSTENTPLSSTDIVIGYDGYITVDDDATLELGSDFEIEQSGWFDTSNSNFRFPYQKRAAASTSITDTDEISGIIYFGEPEELTVGASGAWTDVDISDYVPDTATGAVLHYSTDALLQVGFRMNGCVQDIRDDAQRHGWLMVGIDANDIFECYLEDHTNSQVYLVGFTGSGVTYKTVMDDISLGAALAWTAIDLSVEAPSATGVIVAIQNTDAANDRESGLRKNGSGDNRHPDTSMDGIYYAVVGCDTAQIIEGYVETLDVDFYFMGYITSDFTFNLNADDISIGDVGAWTDIDLATLVPTDTTHIIIEVIGSGLYGLRRNGSTENIYIVNTAHNWAIVECDSNKIIEMEIQNVNIDMFVIGYTQGYIDSPYQKVATATGISSDEYAVKTYGVDNEPAWATGNVLHFTGAADSNVNCGAINNNIAKLWVSLWFKLDSTFSSASTTDQFIWGKFNGAADYVYAYLESDDGKLYFQFDDGANPFTLTSTTVSWTADTWYHIITSLSDTPAQRLLVNGTAEDTDTVAASNTPNGGDFCFGDFDDPGAVTGFIGEIQNVVVGTDDLTVVEEASLYAGTAPADATDYWYMDEGTGTAITSYGTVANTGTADTACSWETAIYATGKTGRLCDFYIEVDDGVTDPDRWGANLKSASVPDNANDWVLNQNNVMPYMDYYKHTVSRVQHAWYQPNYVVEDTDSEGTETAGGSATLITAAEITEAVDYWVGGLVTITGAGGAAPEGETRVCTASTVGTITVNPAFSANVDIGDTFTIDFGTLVDRSCYALSFDGTGDYVNCGNDSSLDVTTAVSYEAWVKRDSVTGDDNFISKGLSPRYMVRMTTATSMYARFRFVGAGSISFTTTDTFPADTWMHIVITWDTATGNILVYKDGQLIHTEPAGHGDTIETNANDLWIGTSPDGHDVEGDVDEVRIYNRAITPDEVTYNYNAGMGVYTPYSTAGLIGWWHIEEGSGTGAILTDYSGKGNTGTLINDTSWATGKVLRPAGNAGTNDSRITWGVNPTGIAASLSSLVSEDQPGLATPIDEPARDVMPEIETSDWYVEPDIGGSLATNPMRPLITLVSDNTTLTELQTWRWLGIAVVLLITVIAAKLVPKHLAIACFAGGAGTLLMVVMTIWPLWTLVLLILFALGGWVSERSPSV